jgi:hypothetical protein
MRPIAVNIAVSNTNTIIMVSGFTKTPAVSHWEETIRLRRIEAEPWNFGGRKYACESDDLWRGAGL